MHEELPFGVQAVVQALVPGQTTAVPAQPPEPLHTSEYVLAFPSLQLTPLAAYVGVHDEVPLGVQAVVQARVAGQTTVVPMQAPEPLHWSA